MNIFVYAMKMEKEGESFYNELAVQAQNPGLKKILEFLAAQEVKHFNVLAEMVKENITPTMADEAALNEVKTIFSEMKGQINVADFENQETSFYEKAKTLEKQSYDFYVDKANETLLDSHKGILLKIAQEEKQHMDILDSIIEFVQQPDQWIEDAEWTKLGQEY